jgi:hypothetical protein
MYRSTFPLTSALDRVGGQRHAPAALPPGKTRYSLLEAAGRRAGLDSCGKSRPQRDSINLALSFTKFCRTFTV